MKISSTFSLIISAMIVASPVSANVIKAATEILVKEGSAVIKTTTKGSFANSAVNPFDLLKKMNTEARSNRKQANLLLDIANGKRVSLKSIAQDTTKVTNDLALEKYASAQHWKTFAYLGKNSKQRHVFVKATPVRISKGINGSDGAYEITHDAKIEIQVIREISSEKLNELYNANRGLGTGASEMNKEINDLMKKAGAKSDSNLLNGTEYQIYPAFDYNDRRNMIINVNLDHSYFSPELLKDVLSELLK